MNFSELKKYQFFQLPTQVVISALIILSLIVIETLSLKYVWANRVDYSFGYIMPMFCIYVLFDRWEKIFGYFQKDSLATKRTFADYFADFFFGSMLVCGTLTFLMFAILKGGSGNPASSAMFPMTFGFSFLFFAMTFFASAKNLKGEKMGLRQRLGFSSLFVFPAFAWIISAPVFSSVEHAISLFLLSKVAVLVCGFMDFFGFLVEMKGNSLCFPNGSVGVADACSGIRSLTACLFAGSFLSAVFLDKLWKKILLVACSMGFAFFNNILRALFLSIWAYENGPDSIAGFVHDAAGYFVLGATVVGLLLLLPIFQFSIVPKEFRDNQQKQTADNSK